jgi:putative drug exporter of the RND superfamily
LKLIGLALTSAILLDAFVIRTLLLPALLGLLGPRTWWFPRWLAQRVPVIAVEPKTPLAEIPRPVPAESAG